MRINSSIKMFEVWIHVCTKIPVFFFNFNSAVFYSMDPQTQLIRGINCHSLIKLHHLSIFFEVALQSSALSRLREPPEMLVPLSSLGQDK